eukprot:jgi/Chlat1/3383/Chrsp23S03723
MPSMLSHHACLPHYGWHGATQAQALTKLHCTWAISTRPEAGRAATATRRTWTMPLPRSVVRAIGAAVLLAGVGAMATAAGHEVKERRKRKQRSAKRKPATTADSTRGGTPMLPQAPLPTTTFINFDVELLNQMHTIAEDADSETADVVVGHTVNGMTVYTNPVFDNGNDLDLGATSNALFDDKEAVEQPATESSQPLPFFVARYFALLEELKEVTSNPSVVQTGGGQTSPQSECVAESRAKSSLKAQQTIYKCFQFMRELHDYQSGMDYDMSASWCAELDLLSAIITAAG